jgi:hypothetical protein
MHYEDQPIQRKREWLNLAATILALGPRLTENIKTDEDLIKKTTACAESLKSSLDPY